VTGESFAIMKNVNGMMETVKIILDVFAILFG